MQFVMKTIRTASALLFALGILLITVSVQAADLPRLTTHFSDTFVSNYAPRFCGENITRLIEQSVEAGIDLENAFIVRIEGTGFWMTQGFAVRGRAFGDYQSWTFHYVLVADGQVFDYDFTDRPRVTPFADYVFEMFVPPAENRFREYQYERTLRESFRFTFHDARAYAANRSSTRGLAPAKTAWLPELLDIEALLARPRR